MAMYGMTVLFVTLIYIILLQCIDLCCCFGKFNTFSRKSQSAVNTQIENLFSKVKKWRHLSKTQIVLYFWRFWEFLSSEGRCRLLQGWSSVYCDKSITYVIFLFLCVCWNRCKNFQTPLRVSLVYWFCYDRDFFFSFLATDICMIIRS